MKRLATISNAVTAATVVLTGSISIPAFASSWAFPISVPLSDMSILLSLKNAASRKLSKLFALGQKKYDSIKLSAQKNLDIISDTISKAIQDKNISSAQFHKTFQDMEKHCKLKEDIWRNAKQK